MRTIEGKLLLDSTDKVVIIASRFNHIIVDRLIEGARDVFLRHGGDENHLDLVLVPGAFELPYALRQVLKNAKNISGVCTLSAIIRGGTPHFDYVSAEATKGIANVMQSYDVPVSFGVLTTDSIDQAIERAGSKAGNKGSEAMSTLIELINLQKKFDGNSI
ncbi:MAG: 6,7-dimethyl-8-ribityllumazine synthase [Helicobacter sp.]|nr:6,7-dimethyl-8-ribityllumazine synthase [Helicobacter sp.]